MAVNAPNVIRVMMMLVQFITYHRGFPETLRLPEWCCQAEQSLHWLSLPPLPRLSSERWYQRTPLQLPFHLQSWHLRSRAPSASPHDPKWARQACSCCLRFPVLSLYLCFNLLNLNPYLRKREGRAADDSPTQD